MFYKPWHSGFGAIRLENVISLNGALTFNNNNVMNNLKRESFSFAGNMKEKLLASQALEKMLGIAVGMAHCRQLRGLSFSLCLQKCQCRGAQDSPETPGVSWKDGRREPFTLWCLGAGLSSSCHITPETANSQC